MVRPELKAQPPTGRGSVLCALLLFGLLGLGENIAFTSLDI